MDDYKPDDLINYSSQVSYNPADISDKTADKTVSYATKGVASAIIGGSALVVSTITSMMFPGLIVGGAIASGSLLLRNMATASPEDKTLGNIGLGLGSLAVITSLHIPLVSGLAGTLLFGSGIGFLGVSGYFGYKFYSKINSVKAISK